MPTSSEDSSSTTSEEEVDFRIPHPPPNKLKFYTSDEVVIHNQPDDAWFVVNNVVFDLTKMIRYHSEPNSATMKYLSAFAGKDLSSYFDEHGEPRMQVSFVTGAKVPIFPAAYEKLKADTAYWWDDSKYQIGRITRQERPIRLINTLTSHTDLMTVCEEDTIYDIQAKYRDLYNHHAGSYIWRKWTKNGKVSGRLFLNRTLTENGIPATKDEIGPPPSLWLFYTNDFTIG
ncbi:cytochrome b5 domain-containing protein 1 [Hermetia illucens]|nr:cytochrome b5 domain-containing protein 1 [Hermetia illucens]